MSIIHEMKVPRIQPDGSLIICKERATSFPRATIVESLLDAQEMGVPINQKILEHQCDLLVRNKRKDTAGGWSYLDAVPELPPDLDDLGSIARVLARFNIKKYAATCEETIAFCLKTMNDDGSRNTWILDPESSLYQLMFRYMKIIAKSDGCHPEVLANFMLGASLQSEQQNQKYFAAAIQFLLSAQKPDGHWETSFYGSPNYATMMVLMALENLQAEIKVPAIAAADYFAFNQQPNGSWENSDCLATANAVTGLLITGHHTESIKRGLQFLLSMQQSDGLWPGGIFVRVETPEGTHNQRNRLITAAFCIKAMAHAYIRK